MPTPSNKPEDVKLKGDPIINPDGTITITNPQGQKEIFQRSELPSAVLADIEKYGKKSEEQKAKELQESILRNAPGIREQSVLNIRG